MRVDLIIFNVAVYDVCTLMLFLGSLIITCTHWALPDTVLNLNCGHVILPFCSFTNFV